MKKLFFVLSIFCCMTINSVDARNHTVNVPVLNLRSCAGTHCDIVGKLRQGEIVFVESHHGEWARVQTDRRTGFVVRNSLTPDNTIAENIGTVLLLMLGMTIIIVLIILSIGTAEYNRKIAEENRKLLETVTSFDRGTWSERDLILALLKFGIPAGAIFHDLYIEKSKGQFSQIDLVVATKVGIIVFEVKDYSGWIFGNGNNNQWTQVLAYGDEKYRFYNPVKQNHGHIMALRKRLWKEKVPYYSVIVFYGNCELRDISGIPDGIFITRPRNILNTVNEIINENAGANYTDKPEIVRILKEAVKNGGNEEVLIRHNTNIEEMRQRRGISDKPGTPFFSRKQTRLIRRLFW